MKKRIRSTRAPYARVPGAKKSTSKAKVYKWDDVTITLAGVVLNNSSRDRAPVFMSADSATRKLMPVATGCLNYFPDALLCVAFISKVGNDKHNPGQPLHWAKEKSTDEPDAEVRHLLDHFRGAPPDPGLEPLGDLGHLASKAWRALAHLQRACDAARVRGV